MIEIRITADNPLEALANVTAYGMLCRENRDVFDTAGAILEAVRSKKAAAQGPATPAVPFPPTTPPGPPSTVPTAPVSPSPAGNAAASPSLTTPSDPAPVPMAGVPVATAPTYTLEQISRAGAELLGKDPNMRDQLMALLAQHGVQAVTELGPGQYGAYATALRGMGARI